MRCSPSPNLISEKQILLMQLYVLRLTSSCSSGFGFSSLGVTLAAFSWGCPAQGSMGICSTRSAPTGYLHVFCNHKSKYPPPVPHFHFPMSADGKQSSCHSWESRNICVACGIFGINQKTRRCPCLLPRSLRFVMACLCRGAFLDPASAFSKGLVGAAFNQAL